MSRELVIAIQECPAYDASRIVVAGPVAAIVAQAIAEVLEQGNVVGIDCRGHIQAAALHAAVLCVDEVSDDAREHDLAKPFVAETNIVVRALRAGGGCRF